MKPLHALLVVLVIFVFARNIVNTAKADSIFDLEPAQSDTTSIWKDDGSLVIIKGAEDAGYVVKGGNDGTEIEYFVKPKDDGSPTFIYDDELIVCTNTGCY